MSHTQRAEDVARYFNLAPRTIREWSTKGLIPCVRVGRLCRYNLEEVRPYIVKPRGPGQPQAAASMV